MQIQNQIFCYLSQPLTNLIPANSKYDINGNFSIAVTVGKNYELVFGANDILAGNGAQNFSPPPFVVIFTASNATLTLGDGQPGVPNVSVTAQLFLLN